jgi:hypothetical protein
VLELGGDALPSHHTENSSRAMRGGWMCCARSACGVTHVNPLPCIIMHTQDAHIKTRATAFFSARADNAALAVSNARTQYLIVYKKLSHFEIKRCVRAAPEPLSKFRKCVPQGVLCVYFCALFFTNISKHAEWSEIF